MRAIGLAVVDLLVAAAAALEPPADVRLGVLLPMFRSDGTSAGWFPRSGVYQAVRELNNKSDGVADELLPNTTLRVSYRDSKCDPGVGLRSAIELTRDAFSQAGVQAIVGAGCSSASVYAAQVATALAVPMVSPSATSPTLSDGQLYPYFLRTIASDAFGAEAMVDVLKNLWNYSTVALVHTTDEYPSAASNAFALAASNSGLGISATRSFTASVTTDFSLHHLALLEAESRVIVMFLADCAPLPANNALCPASLPHPLTCVRVRRGRRSLHSDGVRDGARRRGLPLVSLRGTMGLLGGRPCPACRLGVARRVDARPFRLQPSCGADGSLLGVRSETKPAARQAGGFRRL